MAFIFICSAWITSAQSLNDEFENFLNDIQKDFDSTSKAQQAEFNSFVEQQNREYDDFLKQMDKEYADLLQQGWKEIACEPAFNYFKGNEPSTPPVYGKGIIGKSEKLHLKYSATGKKNVILPGLPATETASKYIRSAGIDFYGTPAKIEFDSLLATFPLEQDNSLAVSKAWRYLSSHNYNILIRSLENIKSKLNLNDWAYYKLVYDFSHSVISDPGKGNMLLCFLMIKSGYDIRLGIVGGKIITLFSCETRIYDKPYLTIQNKKYYVPDAGVNNVQTYSFNYPLPLKRLDLHLYRPLNFSFDAGIKKINLSFNGENNFVDFSYNTNLINFFRDYPQTALDVYVNTPYSVSVNETFLENLRNELVGEPVDSIVRALLYFVQHGFAYKTDMKQFGHEKFFFPEETLTSEYSDCEDRSILFANLVKKLTGLRTVGLNYGGHVLVGVENRSFRASKSIRSDSLEYVLCDPTYVNAPVGVVAPEYNPVTPKIIPFGKEVKGNKKQNNLRLVLKKNHIYPSFYNIAGIDDTNNSFIIAGSAVKDSANPFRSGSMFFVARMDKNHELAWSHTSQSKGNVYNFALTTDTLNCTYAMGTFEDTLTFEDKVLIPYSHKNIFIVKLDPEGNLLWSRVLNMQISDSLSMPEGFEGLLDSKGKIISFRAASLKGLDDPIKIMADTAGKVYFRLRLSTTIPSLDSLILEKGDEFSVVSWLIQENARLIKADYNQSVTGLLAVINLLNASDIIIPGKVISRIFSKQDFFKSSSKNASKEEIGRISSVENTNGVVSMRTVDDNSIRLGSLLFDNDCHFLLMDEQKTERIQVLSGVKIISVPEDYKMNYIIINKYSGEILFDYDDHYKKKMPMQHDVIL